MGRLASLRPRLPGRPPWTTAVVVGLGGLLFLTHVAYVVAAANHALKLFAGYPFDGALQHLNSLYRMADGQRPGADFPVFHGPALPVVHYPLFAAFGGDFLAAELSRRVTSGLAGTLAPLAVICALARRPRTIAIAALAITPLLFWPWLRGLSLPGTSILGVRAAAPLLIVAVLYWLSTSDRPRAVALRRGRWVEAAAGVAAAVAFLLGPEQGLGLLVGLLVAVLVTDGRASRTRERIRAAGILLASFAGGLLVAGSAIMGGGIVDGLRYALVDVPADQGWYFGAPPNEALVDLAGVTGSNLWFVLTFAVLAPVVVWRLRRLDAGAWVVLALSVYGAFSTVSLIGYVSFVNVIVASRVLVLLLAWALILALGRLPARVGGVRVAALLAMAWLAFAAVPVLGQVKREAGYVRAELASPPAPQGRYAGIGVNQDWLDHLRTLDGLARTDCRTMWSTYGGVVEAERGGQNPSGIDYLIHAVGSRREEYLRSFDRTRPDCVVTGRRSVLLGYEEWLWNANWDFYGRLLDGYVPKRATPFSLVWERADEPQLARLERVGLGAVPTDEAVALPATPEGEPTRMYVVRVSYRARGLLDAVPVLGTLPRYAVVNRGTEGTPDVFLPPDRTTWSFPIFVAPGTDPALSFKALSVVPGAGLEIDDLTLQRVSLPERTAAFWGEGPGGGSEPDPDLGEFSDQ